MPKFSKEKLLSLVHNNPELLTALGSAASFLQRSSINDIRFRDLTNNFTKLIKQCQKLGLQVTQLNQIMQINLLKEEYVSLSKKFEDQVKLQAQTILKSIEQKANEEESQKANQPLILRNVHTHTDRGETYIDLEYDEKMYIRRAPSELVKLNKNLAQIPSSDSQNLSIISHKINELREKMVALIIKNHTQIKLMHEGFEAQRKYIELLNPIYKPNSTQEKKCSEFLSAYNSLLTFTRSMLLNYLGSAKIQYRNVNSFKLLEDSHALTRLKNPTFTEDQTETINDAFHPCLNLFDAQVQKELIQLNNNMPKKILSLDENWVGTKLIRIHEELTTNNILSEIEELIKNENETLSALQSTRNLVLFNNASTSKELLYVTNNLRWVETKKDIHHKKLQALQKLQSALNSIDQLKNNSNTVPPLSCLRKLVECFNEYKNIATTKREYRIVQFFQSLYDRLFTKHGQLQKKIDTIFNEFRLFKLSQKASQQIKSSSLPLEKFHMPHKTI